MKRILTSILVLLVLTLSVHPMLTLHFCQGVFQSLNISTLGKNNMCCMVPEVGNNDSFKFQKVELIEPVNTCCIYTNVEVVTDNFTQNNSQTIQAPTKSSYMPGWFVVNYLINLATQEDTSLTSNFNIPIYGSNLKTLDFLSLICIYRL